MADLIQVAADVRAIQGASIATGIAGESLVPGNHVYIDTNDSGKLKGAVNSAEATAKSAGVVVSYAESGTLVNYVTSGELDPGVAVTEGVVYCVSSNAKAIAPLADVTTGMVLTILGVGNATGNIRVKIDATGATVA